MLEVGKIEPRPDRSRSWKASAILRYGELEISGFRINQQPGRKPSVAFPVTEFIKPDGTHCYFEIITAERPVKREIERMILEKWRALYPGHETKVEQKQKRIVEPDYGHVDF